MVIREWTRRFSPSFNPGERERKSCDRMSAWNDLRFFFLSLGVLVINLSPILSTDRTGEHLIFLSFAKRREKRHCRKKIHWHVCATERVKSSLSLSACIIHALKWGEDRRECVSLLDDYTPSHSRTLAWNDDEQLPSSVFITLSFTFSFAIVFKE